MYVLDYKYIAPTERYADHVEVKDLSRDGYTTSQFMDRIGEIVLVKSTAVLYAGGFNIHQAESRDCSGINSRYKGTVDLYKSGLVIKESTAYSMHQWIGNMVKNELVVYANINSNTCASSMYCLYEAERLLRDGVCEEVIIIAEERTSFNTLRIFKEHNIPLVVGDGFAMIRLSNEVTELKVTDTKWAYEYNRNPFGTTQSGYAKVDGGCDVIKPHGTGTDNNNKAEEQMVFGRKTVYYKPEIGHTQGVSALLELCMAIDDDNVQGDVLCVASGLGNFYGSCILKKV